MVKRGNGGQGVRVFALILISLLAEGLSAESDRDIRHLREPWTAGSYTAFRPEQSHEGPLIHSAEVPGHKRIDYYIEFYSQGEGKAYLERCLKRMRPYEVFIRERIAAYGLPFEILYLPIVESAYQVHAVSRAGATGLWQFMANSVSGGDPSGNSMTISQWTDDRRDFWKSTEGSLKKLSYNYKEMGDWFLALAAYNCGLNKMKRIVKKTGISDYFALADGGYLPRETANYVPRFLAIAHLCAYGGRNGFAANYERQEPWVRVRMSTSVDLRVLAEHSGVPLSDLAAGNAELRYSITPPEGSAYYLKVKASQAETVEATLKRTDLQFLKYHLYTIASGDTLSELAGHYGVPVAMIEKYNPGIRANALRIGAKIIIPSIKDVSPYPGSQAKSAAAKMDFSDTHVVRQGDTLWAIAKSRNTTAEELASQNGLSVNGVLKLGQTLKVPPLYKEDWHAN